MGLSIEVYRYLGDRKYEVQARSRINGQWRSVSFHAWRWMARFTAWDQGRITGREHRVMEHRGY